MTTNAQHLAAFIKNENAFAKIFKAKEYDVKNLSVDDVEELRMKVECALSPECLTCDGEIRGAALRTKAIRLHGAQAALAAM